MKRNSSKAPVNAIEKENFEQRKKALAVAMEQIDREFGKGTVMKLGQTSQIKIEAISTGSLKLDLALGIGGIPKGRMVEIYGPESSGKTTLAMHICAEVQKKGGIAAFVDAEHALDPKYAKNLGVDTDELLISQPDTGEQALEITDQLIRSGAVDLVVIDSVAALVPRSEIEGEMGDVLPGLQARLMSQALRKITGSASRTGATLIFINQLRQKIGISYGPSETTTGGNALRFFASVRLDIRRIETLKQSGKEYGNRTRVKVKKNKVSPPFKEAEIDIIYGKGISRHSELVDFGIELALIKKSGTWYSYVDFETKEEIRVGQGRDSIIKFLEESPDYSKALHDLVIENNIPKTEEKVKQNQESQKKTSKTNGKKKEIIQQDK